MRRGAFSHVLAALVALGAGTVVLAQPSIPASALVSKPAPSGCRTAQGSVHFDFEGASRSACYVEDERTLSILITPEHLPPINPSPWYAFRYMAADGGKLTVNVRYVGASHRYAPKWRGRGDPAAFSAAVAQDGSAVSITLPPGEGVVSGQPLMTAAHYNKLLGQLADNGGGDRNILGHSHDGRPVEAVRLGSADAPRLVILLGRQHPPEVTGVVAMDAFALTIARLVRSGAIDGKQYQFLIVPMLNPDGVARGHWRANLGGVDLNRDWGSFSQPETRSVRDWLLQLPAGVKPVLMLDFHSTNRNLVYVQGAEASAQGQRFLDAWLGGKENAFAGFPFSIEPRDANPGSGTTKNWFHATYGIPAYTYEVGDESDAPAVSAAAEALAQTMIPALALSMKELARQ
jgi:predicted deacylase